MRYVSKISLGAHRLYTRLGLLLIDTSIWINVFRDQSGQICQQLEMLINGRDVLLTRFTELELLQGSLNEQE
jgi:predicted nucleic acid-binding protein